MPCILLKNKTQQKRIITQTDVREDNEDWEPLIEFHSIYAFPFA